MSASHRAGTFLAAALVLVTVPAVYAEDAGMDGGLRFKVAVDTVRQSQINNLVVGTGTVAAWREMPISSEANGLAIVEIGVDEGDRVAKGQVLARLNRSLLLTQLEQNSAAVTEAEASLTNALADEQRAHRVPDGVMSKQTIEQRETLVKTSKARLATARGRLEEMKVRLAQTNILAPSDGIVATRSATLGQVVQTGTELFRLIQDARIEVNALIPEADVFNISPRQPARVVDAAGRVWIASVRLVAPVIDEKSRLGTVRLVLPADTDLKPGMFVRVEIETGGTAALTVPLNALVWRDGRPGVFVVNDGIASLKPITVRRKTSAVVEVLHGLDVGERIVVEGAGLLNDGEKVRAEVASVQSLKVTP